MNWICKQKLPATKAIKFNDQLCIKLEELWQALHLLLNLAYNQQVNTEILDEIQAKPVSV